MENKNTGNLIAIISAVGPLVKGLFKKTPKGARKVRNVTGAVAIAAGVSMFNNVETGVTDLENIRLIIEAVTVLIGSVAALVAQFKTEKA